MKILYQIPSLDTLYAARFIYEGYKDAFEDLGHEFKPLTSMDNVEAVFENFNPDLFISSLNFYNLKFLDLDIVQKYRNKGMVFFNQISSWNEQSKRLDASGLKDNKMLVRLIKDGLAGDVFFHYIEQDDPCMDGFTAETGYPFHTILLAANRNRFYYDFEAVFSADISFVGSYLPDKRSIMRERVKPLRKKYKLNLYGNDWTLPDRGLGYVQKFGQYFNIDSLKKCRKLKLALENERKVYSSSTISLNIHEEHQRKYGSDFNERTLKILASGGFQISDYVKAIRKHFSEEELVLARDTSDWFEKIDYYIANPEKREAIIRAGKEKVLKQHTYHNRVEQFISIYKELKAQ